MPDAYEEFFDEVPFADEQALLEAMRIPAPVAWTNERIGEAYDLLNGEGE